MHKGCAREPCIAARQSASPGLDGQDLPFYVLPHRSRSASPECRSLPGAANRSQAPASAPLASSGAGHTATVFHAALLRTSAASPTQMPSWRTPSPAAPTATQRTPRLHVPAAHSPRPHSASRERMPHASCLQRQQQQSPRPRTPLSARTLYESGSAQRMDAMSLLARTARECGGYEAPLRPSHHQMPPPKLEDCEAQHHQQQHRSGVRIAGFHDESSDDEGELGNAQPCTTGPTQRGCSVAALGQLERSSARLERQAASFQALETYERQLAAELSVLSRSLL